ncbi:hypothetical protein FBUS_08983 [Fasciolopsis buskii]|uniref:Uncharacterized protein n=1 Tax=Fasciolopsis buskii TaxID=27845 RepID=A0A8E0S8R6_9TREM|nr:hypothetical protein FBUS_08983 [Fasciolopsis buski]
MRKLSICHHVPRCLRPCHSLKQLNQRDREMLCSFLKIDPPASDPVTSTTAISGNPTVVVRNPLQESASRIDAQNENYSSIAGLSQLSTSCYRSISNSSTKCTSRRVGSPSSVGHTPSVLCVFVPLINMRNCSHVTHSMHQDASEEINTALTCLIRQLEICPLRPDDSVVVDDGQKSDQVQIAVDVHSDGECTAGNEDDESDVLNNVLLGALADLETLVTDPRTCELLVPFVNPIVTRLASIGRFLAHTEDNTRHAMFSNCLAGVLIVVRFLLCCYCYVGHNATFLLFVLVSNRMTGKCLLFRQSYLAREVCETNFMYLLVNLFLLAERGYLEHGALVRSNKNRLNILRLITFLLSSVDPTLNFRVLLRLVYHCGLELDPKRGNRRTSSTRRRSTRLSSTTSVNPSGTESTAASKLTEASLSEEAIFSPGDGPKIYLSVLNNLSYQTRSLNVCVDRLDWFSLFPILNQLISLFGGCSPNTRKESKAEKQPGVDKSVELFSLGKVCSLRILVESYALLGPELLENAKKYAKQVSFCWPQLRVWLVVGRF